MSIVGTSLASSVAQAPMQAQQVAGQRDRVDADSARDSRNIRDLFQSHMSSIEEDESDADAPNNPHIDQNLPDGQGASQSRQRHGKRRQAPEDAADSLTLEGEISSSALIEPAPESLLPPQPVSPDSPLYRHLDVQA